jgi:hypothetical protein
MALILAFAASTLAARSVPTIVLTGALNQQAPTQITVAELERLPQTELTTFDPYREAQATYQGVLLSDLVAAYGTAATQVLLLKAIDEYLVEFHRQEWTERQLLLALRMDGHLLSLRDKGPFKVVMPMAENDNRHYTPKWIWMVTSIEFLD